MEKRSVGYSPGQEDSTIQRLIQLELNYKDNLNYACFPVPGDDLYNSNSFAAGLIQAAGLPLPLTPTSTSSQLLSYPGWLYPMPSINFRP